jgi:hypothetical protein
MARDDVGFMQAAQHCCKQEPFSRSPRLLDAIMVAMGYGEDQLADSRDAQGVLTLDLLIGAGWLGLSEYALHHAQGINDMAHQGASWHSIEVIPNVYMEWLKMTHYSEVS